MDIYAYMCLTAAAFVMPFSMPAGRGLIALTMVLLVLRFFRERKPVVMSATTWMALAFFGVAALSSALGVNPATGFGKLSKLVWYMAIPVAATVIISFRHLSAVLAAYALGSSVLAAMTLIATPVRAMAAFVTDRTMDFGEAVRVLWALPHGQLQVAMDLAREGETTDFVFCLVATGSMTDAQRLMVGIIITLGILFMVRVEGRQSSRWWWLVALQCLALVLNFKRGSWICAFSVAGLFIAMRTTWRHVLLFCLIVAVGVALPPVRQRLVDLHLEFLAERGGRLLMWTKIGPELIRERPWLGVGWRCLTNQMMKKIDPAVEGDRNHLHSNILQIAVETGLIGLAVYLAWMALALRDAIRFVQRTRAGPLVEATPAVALLLALAALLANGVVEYNFADAEIVLIYGLVMGAAAAGCLQLTAPSGRNTARPACPSAGT